MSSYDFSPNAVILVVASTRYDEARVCRDYERFLNEAMAVAHERQVGKAGR